MVRENNRRCNQENVIEQLKNGVEALRMPSDTLVANWAYLVIAAQAWNLKAWMGLVLPARLQARQLVKMEYRRFLREIIEMPCLCAGADGWSIGCWMSTVGAVFSWKAVSG